MMAVFKTHIYLRVRRIRKIFKKKDSSNNSNSSVSTTVTTISDNDTNMGRGGNIYRATAVEAGLDQQQDGAGVLGKTIDTLMVVLHTAAFLMRDKRTYRLLAFASCLMLFWVLLNIGSMTENVNKLTEPTSFWRNVRRVARKTVKATPCAHKNLQTTTLAPTTLTPTTLATDTLVGASEMEEEEEEGDKTATQIQDYEQEESTTKEGETMNYEGEEGEEESTTEGVTNFARGERADFRKLH